MWELADRRFVVIEVRETDANGVRKATFRDPDGNEIGFGRDPV